jgi:hypothetical protein
MQFAGGQREHGFFQWMEMLGSCFRFIAHGMVLSQNSVFVELKAKKGPCNDCFS